MIVRKIVKSKIKENNMNQRWLNFKFLTSFIILIMVTVYSFIYDNSVNSDLWLCVWCICIVRFVDAIDEISKEDD